VSDSGKSRPAPVVDETPGRAAIDAQTRRVVETQAKSGVPVPGGREVADWVRPIVEKTIRQHEERVAVAVDEEGTDTRIHPPGEAPARIDRGDTGEYEPIVREFDEKESPLAKRHMAGPQVLPLEDMRLLARLNLILKEFPDFARKIHAAADDATQRARNDGMTDDDSRMVGIRAEAVLKMAELSGQPAFMGGLGLGDYRNPSKGAPTKLYMQVGGKLVPMPGTSG
jgi:hypothetical protein